jgi:very-short-patch-repair endonuclease
MTAECHPPERLVAKLAARQCGVVTAAQLSTVGIHSDGVTMRVRNGRLHRVHHGVYAVGHKGLSIEGRWMAAVLAVGPEAVLSHRSAAALWRLLPSMPGVTDVLVPHQLTRRRQHGIRIHRSRTITAADRTHRRGIPVTTPARTIADLRRVIPPERLRRAIREAEVLGFDLGSAAQNQPTRSELEAVFLRLCRRHRLSMPEANVNVGPFVVDFIWRERQLIAETDGYQFHRGRQAFEDDRTRDAKLKLMGFDVIRFTYRQVIDDPRRVAQTIRGLLSRPVTPGGQSSPAA